MSWGVVCGRVTLAHAAARSTEPQICALAQGGSTRVGTHHRYDGLGNSLCWCLNSGSTKLQPQPLQTWLPRDRLN